MKDATGLLKLHKRPFCDHCAAKWDNSIGPVVLLANNLCGHLLAGLLWEREFEETLAKCLLPSKSQLVLVSPCQRHKDGGSQSELSFHVGWIAKEDGLWGPNSVDRTNLLGMQSKSSHHRRRNILKQG